MTPRPLTNEEKRHVHPSMQPGVDAGKLWRVQYRPNTAIIDMDFVHPDSELTFRPAPERRVREVRFCPDCDGPLPPRRRYCGACRKTRTMASRRKSTRKRKALERASLDEF